ncbi:MAG TPA: hypothetical protein VFH70_05205, partial [Acidimicrobiales bacterium]|nr:hypothetical protein [Acidimicrobiales bacterium]
LRSKQMGWMTTGGRTKRPTQRMWRGLIVWGGVTGALWLGIALYRMATMSAVNFLFLFVIGLVYVATCLVMPLVARRQAAAR